MKYIPINNTTAANNFVTSVSFRISSFIILGKNKVNISPYNKTINGWTPLTALTNATEPAEIAKNAHNSAKRLIIELQASRATVLRLSIFI